jgi:hypothetical protein
MCYVKFSNIKLGLLTKIVVHFYTDFTSWLPKQVFLLLLCIGDCFNIHMDFEILYQQNESIWYKGIVSIPKVSDVESERGYSVMAGLPTVEAWLYMPWYCHTIQQ